MNSFEPWSSYDGRTFTASAGRISLEAAFSQFVLARTGFPGHELPEIMTAPSDDGETDVARGMVELQGEWLVDAFINGTVDTFIRPIGGGEVVKLQPDKWEIDEPLSRFAIGAINLEQWTKSGAEPTHRIFVDAKQYLNWMRGLQRPEDITEEQLEKIVDPSHVPPNRSESDPSGEFSSSARDKLTGADASSAIPPGVGPRLLGIKQIEDKVGLKKSTIYNRVKDKTFPDWLVIGGRSLWREDEIDQWIANQPRRN